MRRIVSTPHSREYCLRRALDCEWLSENSRTLSGAAESWDRARHWRSLALVAAPEGLIAQPCPAPTDGA